MGTNKTTVCAVCTFLRTVTDVGINVHLLRAKSRVDVLNPKSIPGLELMAGCIGVRLAHAIQTALIFPNIATTCSHSMAALLWIKQCEDIINSCPLPYQSENPEDLVSLTPSTFQYITLIPVWRTLTKLTQISFTRGFDRGLISRNS